MEPPIDCAARCYYELIFEVQPLSVTIFNFFQFFLKVHLLNPP